MAKLFSIKADERPTAKEILHHPWIKGQAIEKVESEYLTLQKRSQSQKLDGSKNNNNYKTHEPKKVETS